MDCRAKGHCRQRHQENLQLPCASLFLSKSCQASVTWSEERCLAGPQGSTGAQVPYTREFMLLSQHSDYTCAISPVSFHTDIHTQFPGQYLACIYHSVVLVFNNSLWSRLDYSSCLSILTLLLVIWNRIKLIWHSTIYGPIKFVLFIPKFHVYCLKEAIGKKKKIFLKIMMIIISSSSSILLLCEVDSTVQS